MKRILIIALGVFIFILILLGITFLESLKNRKDEKNTQQPIPTTISPQRPITRRPLEIEMRAQKKLLEIVKTRPTPILNSDITVREKLVSSLDNKSGTINSTSNYQLDYFKNPNSFEAKIKTNNYKIAQSEVIDFLKSKGLSNDGICKLPLMFYLDFDVSIYLRDQGIEFSPIPDFCIQ